MRKSHALLMMLLSTVLLFSALTVLASAPNPNEAHGPLTILSFTADQSSVRLADVEQGTAQLRVAWRVANLKANHHLALEHLLGGEWQAIENTEKTLPPIGSQTMHVIHPQTESAPTYRLVILDEAGTLLDQLILVIAYQNTGNTVPRIAHFENEMPSVTDRAVAYGEPSLLVSWAITNRTPSSTIIFEQLLADGSTRPVAWANALNWMPSSGQTALRLLVPNANDTLVIRMRVVDSYTGQTYDTVDRAIPVHTIAEPTSSVASAS